MIILRVADRFGFPLGEIENPSQVSRSFQLNKSGQLTFELALNHPKAIASLLKKGNIIICYSNETETWSGEIVKVDWSDTHITVTCFSIEQRLSARRVEPIKFKHSPYGEVFRHLITKRNERGPTGIHLGDVYMGGDRIELDVGAENIYTKITDLCDTSKFEYDLLMINPGVWEMSLYEKRGSDLTDDLALIMGYDTDGAPSYTEDWTTFANTITAVGKTPDSGESGGSSGADDGWTNRPKYRHEDPVSIGLYGLVEDTLELSDISDLATLKKRAMQEVDTRKRPRRSLSFVLTERRDLWGRFREGDILARQIPYYGFSGLVVPFRVLGREISEDTDTMTVAGEVLDGEQAENLNMFRNSQYQAGTTPATG